MVALPRSRASAAGIGAVSAPGRVTARAVCGTHPGRGSLTFLSTYIHSSMQRQNQRSQGGMTECRVADNVNGTLCILIVLPLSGWCVVPRCCCNACSLATIG